MLGDCKGERAAPKLRAIGLFVQTLKNQFDLIPRSLRCIQNLLKRTDNTVVAILEIGCNEMVLGREVSIEGCLRNLRFFDDPIDANGADTFAIKKRSGGDKDLV